MSIKNQTCDVCGYKFTATKDKTYKAETGLTLVDRIAGTTKIFDAIDCPLCGCQMLLKAREPEYIPAYDEENDNDEGGTYGETDDA